MSNALNNCLPQPLLSNSWGINEDDSPIKSSPPPSAPSSSKRKIVPAQPPATPRKEAAFSRSIFNTMPSPSSFDTMPSPSSESRFQLDFSRSSVSTNPISARVLSSSVNSTPPRFELPGFELPGFELPTQLSLLPGPLSSSNSLSPSDNSDLFLMPMSGGISPIANPLDLIPATRKYPHFPSFPSSSFASVSSSPLETTNQSPSKRIKRSSVEGVMALAKMNLPLSNTEGENPGCLSFTSQSPILMSLSTPSTPVTGIPGRSPSTRNLFAVAGSPKATPVKVEPKVVALNTCWFDEENFEVVFNETRIPVQPLGSGNFHNVYLAKTSHEELKLVFNPDPVYPKTALASQISCSDVVFAFPLKMSLKGGVSARTIGERDFESINYYANPEMAARLETFGIRVNLPLVGPTPKADHGNFSVRPRIQPEKSMKSICEEWAGRDDITIDSLSQEAKRVLAIVKGSIEESCRMGFELVDDMTPGNVCFVDGMLVLIDIEVLDENKHSPSFRKSDFKDIRGLLYLKQEIRDWAKSSKPVLNYLTENIQFGKHGFISGLKGLAASASNG